MSKKFSSLLKNERGFTLVELLAVIVILGIITAIAVPGIGKIISNAEDDAKEAHIALIEEAARLKHISEGTPETATYAVSDLISDGYLEEIDSEKLPKTGSVTVTVSTDGKTSYEYSSETVVEEPADGNDTNS
ncbi:competence type IV pilus major pilin ComGC [Sediminibacillus massiliensis]|uniref:competence type IV pilus major pilin ComGC n=1 Tax=Sediminibacillus massiliensis TaxID=1926277 RepID=UPI000988339B|nr:prepilin-type N-terminal cleavage/methylation domain-containing protein [Sediminibacillus massiliensis]